MKHRAAAEVSAIVAVRPCIASILPLNLLILPAVSPAAREHGGQVAIPPVAARRVNFRRDIHPVLAARCLPCHRGANPPSAIRLDVRAVVLGETNGQPLALPGKSEESRLVRAVAGLGEKRMPPQGDRLTPEQVGLLRAWIDQGVAWDDALLPPPERSVRHWAFRPLRPPPIPPVPDVWTYGRAGERAVGRQIRRLASGHPHIHTSTRAQTPRRWARTPIDAFIAAEQVKRGLIPAPEADRRTLIRRLALDLTGLPPTPAEVAAFLRDRRPDAYARQVERLLASPHYGERWGRHWLDVARWAESEGYENNEFRPFAWRYRDYVVQSFNQDKPFDRFVREQVAGDELLPFSDENLVATGFLGAARYSGNEEDKAMQRNDVLVDITNATASAFLGLTLGCAQCHDHKIDPISQRDYYRFHGFFVQGQVNNLILKDPKLWAAYTAALPAEYRPAVELRDALLNAARRRLVEEARKALTPEQQAALAKPAGQRTPMEAEFAGQSEAALQPPREKVAQAITGEDRKLYDSLVAKLKMLEKDLPPKPQTIGFYSPATSPTALELLPLKANFPLPYDPAQLRRTRPCLLLRGDPDRRGPELAPGWPAVLGATSSAAVAKRPRTALAAWLTSPSNPLTARVWVNRVWHYHFGRGLVATPGDFGLNGARPTHPALLDWLAARFARGSDGAMENGSGGRKSSRTEFLHRSNTPRLHHSSVPAAACRPWSTKALHRLIVLSATYRQAARPHRGNRKRDPENRFLWRWAPRRLEAEAVRDSLLAVSGELDRKVGGPSVPLKKRQNYYLMELPEETGKVLRRTLYLEQRRDALPPTQSLFDGPSANESCPRRHVSTVALQPLFLLNSQFALDRATAFARRLVREAGADRERQITLAFELALARPPDVEERAAARSLLGGGASAATNSGAAPVAAPVNLCQMLMNANEFIYLQ